ncbi:MAG: hypothetical protein AAAB16_26430 [Pseudomonas sp.]|uniref:hypothetical protein n=1 Tax=Pseudomonas sp. TaxID=306 RepID=UPI0030F05E6F
MASSKANRKAFLAIAVAALAAHQSAWAALMGAPTTRPAMPKKAVHQECFNQALVAIVFSCNYLEAALYCHGRARLGRQYEDAAVYETKLQWLGIHEASLLAQAKQLRIVRRELMHEQAMEIANIEPSKVYVTQNEAEKAVALALEIKRLLRD